MKYCVPYIESVCLLFFWTKGFLADACKNSTDCEHTDIAKSGIFHGYPLEPFPMWPLYLVANERIFGHPDSCTELKQQCINLTGLEKNHQLGSGSRWEGQTWKWADHSQVLICKSCWNSSVWCLMKCLLYSKLPNRASKRQLNPEQSSSDWDSQTSQEAEIKPGCFLKTYLPPHI